MGRRRGQYRNRRGQWCTRRRPPRRLTWLAAEKVEPVQKMDVVSAVSGAEGGATAEAATVKTVSAVRQWTEVVVH